MMGGFVVDPARRGVLSFWMGESGRIGEAGYLLLVIFVMFFLFNCTRSAASMVGTAGFECWGMKIGGHV